MNAYAMLEIRGDRRSDIQPDEADRGSPAKAQTRGDIHIEDGRISIACIDEGGHAPVIAKVMLVLEARDREILAADHAAFLVHLAYRLIVEAAQCAIAACEESQLRRQCVEIVDDHRAGGSAQDETAAFAARTNPLRFRS